MRTRKRDTAEAMPLTTSAKIGQEKDLCKVLTYFRYKNVPQRLDLFNNEPCTIGDLSHAPIRDARSGECNIMALYQKRKEGHNG